jgi:hypothetical protein
VYGEGKAAAYLEKGKFSGIPVLFIPGNSGSYKQVRSLASVALRQPYKTSHLASESEYCHSYPQVFDPRAIQFEKPVTILFLIFTLAFYLSK